MKLKERMAEKWAGTWSDCQEAAQCGVIRLCRENPFPVQLILILVYRAALDTLYLTVLSPIYAYSGFTIGLSLFPYLCSWLAVLVFTPFVIQLASMENASSMLVTFLNFLYFIPLTSYCGCKGMNAYFFLIALVYWGLLLFWQFRLPVLYVKPIALSHSRPVIVALTVASSLFVLYISWRYTGLRFTLDFIHVYDIRAEAATYQMPVISSYVLSMMHIVMAALLLYWLQKKRYLATVALVIVYLFLYSISAHKSTFFFLLLLLASYILFRPWMLRWLPGLLPLATAASFLEWNLVGTSYLTSYLFRRMMYVPVKLSETYFTFFQENPLNLFRNGIMGKLSFHTIYSTDIPVLIGEFTGEHSSANNGLLGDMFANLPIPLGLLLMPLILVICFRLLDLSTHAQKKKIVIPFCLYFAICFMNSSWSTVLLSHGFLLSCLLLYFFPNEEAQPL